MNGSSKLAGCSGHTSKVAFLTNGDARATCRFPGAGVLFDEQVHTIQPMEEYYWARELATMRAPTVTSINLHLGDIGDSRINKVEIVMFNCPWWGIGVETIRIYYPVRLEVLDGETVTNINPTTASCESLVKFCVPCIKCGIGRQLIGIEFQTLDGSSWVHLAEVIIHFDSNTSSLATCPQDLVIASSKLVISSCNRIVNGIADT